MSAFNIQLRPSRYYLALLLGLATLPLLLMAVTTLNLPALCVLALLCALFYYLWFDSFVQSRRLSSFTLDGEMLHWFAPTTQKSAQKSGQQTEHKSAQHYRLLPGGLVSQVALRLCRQSLSDNKPSQFWVFADQCAPEQYSALARAVNQLNWQSRKAL